MKRSVCVLSSKDLDAINNYTYTVSEKVTDSVLENTCCWVQLGHFQGAINKSRSWIKPFTGTQSWSVGREKFSLTSERRAKRQKVPKRPWSITVNWFYPSIEGHEFINLFNVM